MKSPLKTKMILCAFFLLITMLCLTLASCKNAPRPYTEKDDGKSITIRTGESFQVRLSSNPTTGYSWQLLGLQESIVKMVSLEYVEASRSKDVVGSGGHELFVFQGASEGETQLRLAYQRPWEEDVEPLEVFEVHIKVTS